MRYYWCVNCGHYGDFKVERIRKIKCQKCEYTELTELDRQEYIDTGEEIKAQKEYWDANE